MEGPEQIGESFGTGRSGWACDCPVRLCGRVTTCPADHEALAPVALAPVIADPRSMAGDAGSLGRERGVACAAELGSIADPDSPVPHGRPRAGHARRSGVRHALRDTAGGAARRRPPFYAGPATPGFALRAPRRSAAGDY